MKNKIISKKKFLEINKKISKNILSNKKNFNLYKSFLKKMLPKRIAHQTLWLGEPILQLPQDLMIFQELIFKTKPDYFVEVGVAWSGSLLYYSTIFNILGGKKIIGIDNFIPKEIDDRIKKFKKLQNKIKLINGISTDEKVLMKLKKILNNSKKIIIHLDSDHSQENVLKELELYSKLVKKNSYIICGDTHVEFFNKNPHGQNKKYSKGDNPMTALKIFLRTYEGKKFKQDLTFQNRYFLTLNPFGILKKIRD